MEKLFVGNLTEREFSFFRKLERDYSIILSLSLLNRFLEIFC